MEDRAAIEHLVSRPLSGNHQCGAAWLIQFHLPTRNSTKAGIYGQKTRLMISRIRQVSYFQAGRMRCGDASPRNHSRNSISDVAKEDPGTSDSNAVIPSSPTRVQRVTDETTFLSRSHPTEVASRVILSAARDPRLLFRPAPSASERSTLPAKDRHRSIAGHTTAAEPCNKGTALAGQKTLPTNHPGFSPCYLLAGQSPVWR